jgi:ArsR family transcriptional regulator
MDAAGSRAHDAVPSAPAPLGRGDAEQLARTLRAVADPTRLQVLSMLNASTSGEAVVGDLAAALGLRQPTVSHHLRIMHEDGLLIREQRGRQVFYAIAVDRRDEIADLLR